MIFNQYCFFSLIFIQLVFAQFRLIFPAPRGDSEANQSLPPCGGYDVVNNSRTHLPLETPFVEIVSEREAYNYKIHVILGNNPSAGEYFDTSSSFLSVANGTRNFANSSCLHLQLPKNIKENTNATLQVAYNSSNEIYFQCTDVTFSQSLSNFDTSICFDSNESVSPSQPTSVLPQPAALDQASDASDSFHLVTWLMLVVASLVSFLLI